MELGFIITGGETEKLRVSVTDPVRTALNKNNLESINTGAEGLKQIKAQGYRDLRSDEILPTSLSLSEQAFILTKDPVKEGEICHCFVHDAGVDDLCKQLAAQGEVVMSGCFLRIGELSDE